MNFDEYYAIGESYYEEGEYKKALNHFKKCISIDN
ncbi:tetratricopeptide repeat protein [Hathewaya histolytica]